MTMSRVSREDAQRCAELVIRGVSGTVINSEDLVSVWHVGWSSYVESNLRSFLVEARDGEVCEAEATYLVSCGVDGVARGLVYAERYQELCVKLCWTFFDSIAHRGMSEGWYGILGNVVGAGLFLAQFEERDPHFDMVRVVMDVLGTDGENPLNSVQARDALEGILARVM
jgi:hypothetical protein